MTLTRMPMFMWVMLVDSWLIVIAIPPLTAAQIMLLIDRFLGGNFFNTQAGGSAVLWQHFFWIFGHPEVYILIFPAFAILYRGHSGVFAEGDFRVAGDGGRHRWRLGLSAWACGRTTCLRWDDVVGIRFSRCRACWYRFRRGSRFSTGPATMYGGKIRLDTPMLFSLRISVAICVAGLTGIMLAVAPFDWQLHDTYFVVGHFHFTLIGGLVFGLFAGFITGFRRRPGTALRQARPKWHFWLFVIGFDVTFVPMHFPGMLGMPRRIFTYEPGRGWELWNLVSSLGVIVRPRLSRFLFGT